METITLELEMTGDHWGGHEIADRLHKILETSVSVKITFNTNSESDNDYSYCIYITVP
jgi:hypothetical protein